MLMKSCPARIKAAGEQDGLPAGQFEAIVSVFGNKDSYGDVVMPGAFKDTLAEWAESGDPIPVYYSHRMDDPDFNIGHVLEAKETDEGLWVRAQLDVEDPVPGSKATQVHRLLKGRRVTQFSFAYDVREGGWATRKDAAGNDEEFYELRNLKVYEVGPTPIGANQETELLAVKSAMNGLEREVKAGRVLSAKNETALREARYSIDSVLASLGTDDEKAAPAADQHDQEKASGTPEAKPDASDEEPTGAKSSVSGEEPNGPVPPVNALAAQATIYALASGGERTAS